MVRGLSAEGEAKLQAGAPFTCKGPEGKPITLPFAALNDDYCDCADGFDEPGTGACAGQETTMFHCKNEGSTPQLIYTSRVDDGICDCCDGSDETGRRGRAPGGVSCPNDCLAQGEVERKHRAERIEAVRAGLQKKHETITNANANRKQWQADVQRLEADLPGLEEQLSIAKRIAEAAKAVADRENAATGGETVEALRAENEELKKTIARQQAKIDELQTDVDIMSGKLPAGPPKEKKVVSEYAKWMDGAGETPGAIEDEEGIPVGEGDEDEGINTLSSAKPVVTPGSGAAATASSGKTDEEKAVQDLEAKVRDNKDEVQSLKKKLDHMLDTHLGYADLAGNCLSKHDGQYTYKACFYDDAKQDHTSLGRWKGWTGPRTAEFTDGQMCPGGPARMLRVLFECGSEEALLEIAEPSRCVYEVHATSRGACDESDLEALQKPPVRHPKEEL